MRLTPRMFSILLVSALISGAAAATENAAKTFEPGASAVSGAGLESFVARYRTVLVRDGKEQNGHTRTSSLEEVMYPGGPGLRFNIAMVGREGTVYDEIHLLRDTLAPVMRTVSALAILHKIEVFDETGMKGFTISKDGATAESLDIQPQGRRFAGGTLSLILAGLPLAEGYEATFPVFSSDMGPAMANLLSHVRVVGRERIEAAGRTYDTWVVETTHLDGKGERLKGPGGQPIPKTKQWLSSEVPYEIRTQWGASQTVELVELPAGGRLGR